MHTIELVTIDGKSIYQGRHNSLNEAIESAIIKNIPLHEIDLSGATLHHINLDGVQCKGASFQGADLTGANMSEAEFSGCDFSSANLKDTCLCYSNFIHCNFRLCAFKETDISMSSLQKCDFEGFDTFSLRFHSTFKMEDLTYHHFAKKHMFDSPPTLIQSGNRSAVIFENVMIIKDVPHTLGYNALRKTHI